MTKLPITALTAIGIAAGTILIPPVASAGGHHEPGASCEADDLGTTDVSSVGTPVRCLANGDGGYSWTSDTGASSVIRNLEAAGYTVNVERFGHHDLDQCTMTGIRNPQTITRTDRTGPGNDIETTVVSKTITVSLDCG